MAGWVKLGLFSVPCRDLSTHRLPAGLPWGKIRLLLGFFLGRAGLCLAYLKAAECQQGSFEGKIGLLEVDIGLFWHTLAAAGGGANRGLYTRAYPAMLPPRQARPTRGGPAAPASCPRCQPRGLVVVAVAVVVVVGVEVSIGSSGARFEFTGARRAPAAKKPSEKSKQRAGLT